MCTHNHAHHTPAGLLHLPRNDFYPPGCGAGRGHHGVANRRAFRQRRHPRAAPGYRPSRRAGPKRRRAEGTGNGEAEGRPGGFFTDAAAALITPGNFEDDLARLAGVRLDHRGGDRESRDQARLWAKVDAVRRRPVPSSPPTPAASRLPQIAEGFSDEFRRHFLGTHFFNPPRYLHLLEIIPGPDTAPGCPSVASATSAIAAGQGRGAVQGHAELHRQPHRLASSAPPSHKLRRRRRLHHRRGGRADRAADRPAEQRQLPPARHGRRSTSGRTSAATLRHWCPTTRGASASLPAVLRAADERGWLGDKTRPGLLQARRARQKEIHALDWKTLEYHPRGEAEVRRRWSRPGTSRTCRERLRAAGRRQRQAPARFLWKLFRDSVALFGRAWCPEISDRIVEIDRAMRWGYAHKLGPVRAVGRARVRSDGAAHGGGRAGPAAAVVEPCCARGANELLPARRSRRPAAHRVLRPRRRRTYQRSKTAPGVHRRWPTSSARAAW